MPHLPDFEGWAIFAKVAERGSFSGAAEELGLAKTTVSKAVSRLEERMGTTLFHRTTRKLSLTESGRLSLDRAARIMTDGRGLESDMLEEAATPRGLIRFAATTAFGSEALAPVLPQFLAEYPEIEVELCLTEERVDVILDGYDLAVQIGQSSDLSLRSSRLFSFRRPLIASPALLERYGTPTHPNQLVGFPAIIPIHVPWGHEWRFEKGEEVFELHAQGRLRVNNAAAMVAGLLAGTGMTIIPEYFIWRHLEAGALVELLPDWKLPSGPIYVVTPPGRTRPARVRALLEFLRRHFASQPWAHGVEH
jgi:DNA-binding transcriptional LysR family regulator